ncbi:TIGR04255 family protein [Paenibacillus sp. FSL K6-4396]|uniref:TIGR04255 family protein n=1 Tax=Paenibacillus sp. FSL K6-4396 TaxID=2921506 RepID=UPI0030F52FF7
MKNLKNKPLLETVLEIKWTTKKDHPKNINLGGGNLQSFKTDEFHKIFFAKMYDHLLNTGYPEYLELPQAGIPEEFATHQVQHRFTQSGHSWPMVQIGPGILTLNEALNYEWENFHTRSIQLVDNLYKLHPKKEDLIITQLQLRYINAIDFNFEKEDIHGLLRKLKININYDKSLFEATGLLNSVPGMSYLVAFKSAEPKGELLISLTSGEVNGVPKLMWELTFRSNVDELDVEKEFEVWVDGAHRVIDRWFLTSIEGEMQGRFE